MTEMTCREFDEVVHGFVRMELLDLKVREAALEHAAHCALCSERMADAAALSEISGMMRQSVREEQTPLHVEGAVVSAFHSHQSRASWKRGLEWASVGAAAAVLIIFLWAANGRWNGQSSPAPRKDVSTQSRLPLDANAATVSNQNQDYAAPVAPAAKVKNTSASEPYAASDFVPVPFTSGVTADDPGMVVRVQLTRASLAQLGYPVAESPDEDLILADVLVGEDGWPRGVKLIQ